MRIGLLFGFLVVTSLSAQTSIFCVTTPLDIFLGMTCGSPQWNAIERNNSEHRSWRDRKEQRIYQVKDEIYDETKRSPLDPTALGLRYAEIEAICREIDDREKQLVVVNRNALNEAQKGKLAVLDAAMQLVPTGNQAMLRRLMEGTPNGVIPANRIVPIPVVVPVTQRAGACSSQGTTGLVFGISPY